MRNLQTKISPSEPRLLNVGCGTSIHPSWINIDLVARHPQVIQHDLTKGIPFEENWFDAVYHSHVLEHLAPDDGRLFIRECRRVLKPTGTIRVVVPDLEGIAKSYLESLQRAGTGDENWIANHCWMQLELIDQMVRSHSGGKMGEYMTQNKLPNENFLRTRMGDEFLKCRSAAADISPPGEKTGWLKRKGAKLRDKTTRLFLTALYGKSAYQQFLEARFRGTGEVHRWMYDQVSLGTLLRDEGFEDVQPMQAESSMIPNYVSYQLDSNNNFTRKPDSLFVEGRKTAKSNRSAA